jgi:hypothetical protein
MFFNFFISDAAFFFFWGALSAVSVDWGRDRDLLLSAEESEGRIDGLWGW